MRYGRKLTKMVKNGLNVDNILVKLGKKNKLIELFHVSLVHCQSRTRKVFKPFLYIKSVAVPSLRGKFSIFAISGDKFCKYLRITIFTIHRNKFVMSVNNC